MGLAEEQAMNFEVKKRNGSSEYFDPEKIHRVVEWAVKGLTGVSSSDIEMNSHLQISNEMETVDIHKVLTRSASDLISLENPNYQYVAARLALFNLVKDVHGDFKYPPLGKVIRENVDRGVYDPSLLTWYKPGEIRELSRILAHGRNWKFSYAGLQQVIDKYLIRDRVSGSIYETPQFMYMGIAMTLFHRYPEETRLMYTKRYYHAISNHLLNLPTPILCGVRTPLRQYASCCLIDVDDNLDSIFASDHAIGRYVAQRSGIGINSGRIRAIGSKIRHGEVEHTGQIPFLKKFESTVRCCTQNGVRGGSATVHYPFWHFEIEDIIVLKNNKGTEDNRVRRLDYSIQFSKIFYERFLKGEKITLFSPHEVPKLVETFGTPDFDQVYEMSERRQGIRKKKVDARELFESVIAERIETGRVYIMNVDHANSHSSFDDRIVMSNLCQEITLPTTPITHIDDEEGEIALCILSALNLGALTDLGEMEDLCELAVRGLDEIIDIQEYPVKSAGLSAKKRRSLGIGFIGVAHHIAKNETLYTHIDSAKLMDEATEHLQYWCLKAGVKLAQEKGKCELYDRTKYSRGVLPIDTYKKSVDDLYTRKYTYDWEALRAEIQEHGLRNSTYTAFMPSESSSVVSNSTQGIDPIRSLLTVKKSKQGLLKQVVPDYKKYGKYYQTAWDMAGNLGYLRVCAAIQKYTDQSISANQWFVFSRYENSELPLEEVMKETLMAYKLGLKTLYYLNTEDGSGDQEDDEKGCSSGSCAI